MGEFSWGDNLSQEVLDGCPFNGLCKLFGTGKKSTEIVAYQAVLSSDVLGDSPGMCCGNQYMPNAAGIFGAAVEYDFLVLGDASVVAARDALQRGPDATLRPGTWQAALNLLRSLNFLDSIRRGFISSVEQRSRVFELDDAEVPEEDAVVPDDDLEEDGTFREEEYDYPVDPCENGRDDVDEGSQGDNDLDEKLDAVSPAPEKQQLEFTPEAVKLSTASLARQAIRRALSTVENIQAAIRLLRELYNQNTRLFVSSDFARGDNLIQDGIQVLWRTIKEAEQDLNEEERGVGLYRNEDDEDADPDGSEPDTVDFAVDEEEDQDQDQDQEEDEDEDEDEVEVEEEVLIRSSTRWGGKPEKPPR